MDTTRSTRRDFLKTSAGVTLAGGLDARLAPAGGFFSGPDRIRVGLIGCGGRGTGAAAQALKADPAAHLVAVHDAFADHADRALASLGEIKPIVDRIDVPAERRFTGFDGYLKLMDSGVDVVVMASPPHFRPMQMAAAVERGLHVFCEKPIAVDAPGVRSVMASCEKAKAKRLSIVSGLCYRYHHGRRAVIQKIHDGAIGDVRSLDVNYITGALWHRGKKPEWSEMEFQVRNWLYWTWLSGDLIAEQHIHSLDVAAWVLGDRYPNRCVALGGRQVRTDPQYGNVYDHFATRYEYDDDVKVHSYCRQMPGCAVDVSDNVRGTKGYAEIFKHSVRGAEDWEWEDDRTDMYQNEHDELFGSIRDGKPINNGEFMCKSTLMAIMGRMAAYTGQAITWDQAWNSQEVLAPASYDWGKVDPALSKVAMPGITKFA
jgi:predicted dehydrogenase